MLSKFLFARFSGFIVLCAFVPVMIGACTPVGIATGAGAATGIAAAREGGIRSSINDARINADISDKWFKYDLETFTKLNLTVDRGRVLITGVVQDPQHRVEAVRLAWQAEGVEQIINEIHVADSQGIKGYLRDTWISTQIRTALTFNREVQSINYTIDTVQGIVYLMGVSHSRSELDKVKDIARSVDNVRQVVSYIKLRGTDSSYGQ